ncbi:MAG: (2Fe-2S)-binding protein [Candidatus Eiseniibacteriota bacterium]|nr:MAG: (2Fe-2S)-binding protein [Candidatus Eisenbacteria bacterium]
MKGPQDSATVARVQVSFRLNGVSFRKRVPVDWTLLRYLREGLGYYGTKCGCEIGDCGACTVLYDGVALNACLILAPQVDGVDIWTIEGVAPQGERGLHPVQQAFVERGAVHCGFCTPGFVMSTIALFLETRNPSRQEIKEALAGNLCRCTGYIQILDAVKTAASRLRDRDLKKFVSRRR